MKPVSLKTNRTLLIICVAFLIIGVRILHLGVVQREDKLKEAEKPKLRTLLVRADRGEICDRFSIPLATNQIRYNATIYYSQIGQIPSRGWGTNELGAKVRTYPRRDHIKKLAQLLEKELGLEAERTEDLIHSKASLFPHVPFILKANLEEKEFYRLKMLEKDWPGLYAEIGSERHYPQGKVGCHLLGMLGSISQKQYMAIAEEIHKLQDILTSFETLGTLTPLEGYDSIEEVYERLDTLKDKAYTLNDKVGKSGIEGQFEEDLRGLSGIKILEVDNQGKPLRELPNSKQPVPGKKITLSISSELQQFAEELLIQSEKDRDRRSLGIDPADQIRKEQKQPWIKGGSIVAIDPKTGEILALASYPRFDPNDFSSKSNSSKGFRYLENEQTIGALWDGKEPLLRERPLNWTKKIGEENTFVTWEFFLGQILPKTGPLRSFFEKIDDIKGFVQIQEDFQALLYFSKGAEPSLVMEALTAKNTPLWETLRGNEDASLHLKRLDSSFHSIPSAQDRLFVVDLCKLCVFSPRFSDELLGKIGSMKIHLYRDLNQAFCRFSTKIKESSFKNFHLNEFHLWKEKTQKEFLTKKRAEEKEKKTYAKPYIDYLDKQEKELFSQFWDEHGIGILLKHIESKQEDPDQAILQKHLGTLPPSLAEEFIRTFRFFDTLDRPVFTKYAKIKTEKDLASIFYPLGNFGFCRSYAYQASSPQGSIFKLIPSYEGLRQGHNITIIDDQKIDPNTSAGKNLIVAFAINQTPYPRQYKGGRLPKSHAPHIGKIDVVGAIERTSNPYFGILAGDYLSDPEDLNVAASLFGYGGKTGIDLPGEVKGNLPNDLRTNKTGLYAYSIGQHTQLCTPLQSALMLSTLANGGHLLKPQIVIDENKKSTPIIKHSIWYPESIRNTLFEGMDKCVWGSKGSARASGIKSLLANPLLMRDYLLLQHQMIGKTSTAEILYNPGRYPSSKAQIYKHTWFGSIAFHEEAVATKTLWESPELVVVVFLRFGDAGKEGAPLAAQMIRKWREIKTKHRL
jgi:cell division protein FtsI/penicillin-binding protein 2